MRIAPRRRCTLCQGYLDADGTCSTCDRSMEEMQTSYQAWLKQQQLKADIAIMTTPKKPLFAFPLPFDPLDDEA